MKNNLTTLFAWLVGGAVLAYLSVFGVGTGSCSPWMALGASGVAGYGSFILTRWFGRGKAKDVDTNKCIKNYIF